MPTTTVKPSFSLPPPTPSISLRVRLEMAMAANIEIKARLWFRATRSIGLSLMRDISEV